jgi:Mg-chelatase subunit ChlI
MSPKRPVYPFAALVGQERLKLAPILNAINPLIGGVLIRGEKGTAKSTAARGLAELLPPIAMVAGCPHHRDPGGSRGPVRGRQRRQEAILPSRTIDNYRRLSYRINTPHPRVGIMAPVS